MLTPEQVRQLAVIDAGIERIRLAISGIGVRLGALPLVFDPDTHEIEDPWAAGW